MNMLEFELNGQTVAVPEGITILEAAKTHGVRIPSLCYHPDQTVKSNCRVCVVEVEGQKSLVAFIAHLTQGEYRGAANHPAMLFGKCPEQRPCGWIAYQTQALHRQFHGKAGVIQ